PFELTAGQLRERSMVTTGAITNRVDRLAQRGLVERAQTQDRRRVLVRLYRAWTGARRPSCSASYASRSQHTRPTDRGGEERAGGVAAHSAARPR
ncbi:MAG: MarR family transcriptional regulator, partial [Nocardioidaceae bacterium]|nr:MarR family transcriptional regulator [Nocardioidaceae bacterium]